MQIKEDSNETVNHVEHDLRKDIDSTWECAVWNEQYSRKNNIRLLGLKEEPDENLKDKFISCMQENLGEEVKPEEIEIIHRVGVRRVTDRNDQRSTQIPKPRVVIAKLVSNKTKMCLHGNDGSSRGKSWLYCRSTQRTFFRISSAIDVDDM